jgi:atypical dual specificity phosphatase
MSKPGNFWRKIHGKVTKKPTNFSWLIESKLAGCGMPTTINEVNWVLDQGIKSIITMTENSLPESWVKDTKYLHVPTEDLNAPDIDKIEDAVKYEKYSAKKAIEKVRKERPGSIQSERQELVVGLYGKHVRQ